MIKKLINKLLGKGNPMYFQQGFDLTGLPIVTFNQGDKKFNFILDTGSNRSVIEKSFLADIQHTMLKSGCALSGLEGIEKAAQSCVIPLTYKDNIYESDFLVTNMLQVLMDIKQDTGVSVHGLLGSNFFRKFQYVLDFKELIAYSRR